MCEPEVQQYIIAKGPAERGLVSPKASPKRAGRFMTTCDFRTCVEEDEQPSDAPNIKWGLDQSQKSSVRPFTSGRLSKSSSR
jgi:hypothetical protein